MALKLLGEELIRPPAGYPVEIVELVRRMYCDDGFSQPEIAKALNTTVAVIWRVMNKNGIKSRFATRATYGECTFRGCNNEVEAKGLCNGHYQQDRLGKPLTPLRRPVTVDEKNEIVRLYESGQSLKQVSAAFGRNTRTVSDILNDVGSGTRRPGWPVAQYGSGSVHPRWRGNDISIGTAHSRLRRIWGSAGNYPCISCGGTAAQWAYDGTDPDQRYRLVGKRKYYAYYSVYPEFYMPMCSLCHRRRDGEMQRLELFQYRTLKNETGLSIDEMRVRLVGMMSSG